MAVVDYFLKIDGIPGESKAAKHKGEIDVTGWSWGETATAQPGGGKVQIQDLNFTARLSKASPRLMRACATGQHIKEAVLTARRGGKNSQEFLVVRLEEIVVASYQTGAGAGEAPGDSVALNFSKITVEYREFKADGSVATTETFGFDVKQGKEL